MTHFKCRQTVLDWMAENEYVDIWRAQHEGFQKFTWFSNPRARCGKGKNSKRGIPSELEVIACRLDFFLVPIYFQQTASYTSIISGYHSDHNMLTLTVKFENCWRGRGFWKLNCSLLEEPDYVNTINR